MDIIAADASTAENDGARDHLLRRNEVGVIQSAGIENLNVETVTTNPLLPTQRKWAIRFNAGGTVTAVLGMKDYGRGWFSGYFAGLVAARLGIPFSRIRIYYSATVPAVLRTPQPSGIRLHVSGPGPVPGAVTDIVGEMCGLVVEKGRLAFAEMAGVGAAEVAFDQPTGRFFVLDGDRSASILEIAEIARERSASIELTENPRQDGSRTTLNEVQAPRDARGA